VVVGAAVVVVAVAVVEGPVPVAQEVYAEFLMLTAG
jgi:hypothetical protein